MPWAVFCDESGDVGFDLEHGSTPLYVVTHLLVKTGDVPQLRRLISRSKRNHLNLRKMLQWKNLSAAVKIDDKALSAALYELRVNLTYPVACSVIVEKAELLRRSSSLTDPKVGTLTPYVHGLCLKRELFFLKQTQGGFFVIDRNSNPEINKTIRDYLVNRVPSRYFTQFPANYAEPRVSSPKEEPGLQLADFVSGALSAAFRAYKTEVQPYCETCAAITQGCLRRCEVPYLYRETYRELCKWYIHDFRFWSWRGLMYFPYPVLGSSAARSFFAQ